MADESNQSRDLKVLGAVWAKSVSEDLSGLLELEVSLSGPAVEEDHRDTLLGSKGSLVCSSCSEQIYFVLSRRAAFVLAAAQMHTTPGEFADFQKGAFEGEVEQAYKSVMDVCVGIFGRVLDEEAGLPSIQLGESAVVEVPVSGAVPEAGSYRRARFDFEIHGFPKESLDVLVASDRAREWFGEAVSGGDNRNATGPLALVDPDSESRDAFAAFANALGRDVLTLDPAEFDDESMEELAQTSSVVLAWDLGGRSGLDVLEKLRADERTAGLRIAIASDKPTRAMVDAALRWGAHTVLFKPWDASEISERLLT